MTQTLKSAVIGILTDGRMSRVSFGYGPTVVYPSGYSDIARQIDHGHIQIRLTGGNASFDPRPERGETHWMSLSAEMGEIDSGGTIRVRGRLSTANIGTIVHEATHALQDYQRLDDADRLGGSLSPRMAEGAAYVAGWIARLQWGDAPLAPGFTPRTSHAYARLIAGQILDGTIADHVPRDHVRELNGMVLTGHHDSYRFHGI